MNIEIKPVLNLHQKKRESGGSPSTANTTPTASARELELQNEVKMLNTMMSNYAHTVDQRDNDTAKEVGMLKEHIAMLEAKLAATPPRASGRNIVIDEVDEDEEDKTGAKRPRTE